MKISINQIKPSVENSTNRIDKEETMLEIKDKVDVLSHSDKEKIRILGHNHKTKSINLWDRRKN
jgi:hypothetical protein